MDRRDYIALALQGSKGAEASEEATNIYVDLAEHLLTQGHASSITEIDIILKGMSIDSAEGILESIESGESLSEDHKEVSSGEKMDREGYMVGRQMDTAEAAIKRIRDYIGEDGDKQFTSWVQAKLTTAADYLDAVADYLMSDSEEG